MIPIPVSPGELLDRISILELKAEHITEPLAASHVQSELSMLREARSLAIADSDTLEQLAAALAAANRTLWDVEDALRRHEQALDFGPNFISLARRVYKENDRRAALKREINHLLGSELVEEKLYASYDEPHAR